MQEKKSQMGIGARLRLIQERNSLSIKAFAERCGLPYRTVQNYLSATREPNAEALGRICTQMGVDANWILTGKGYEPATEPTSATSVSTASLQPEPNVDAIIRRCRAAEARIAELERDVARYEAVAQARQIVDQEHLVQSAGVKDAKVLVSLALRGGQLNNWRILTLLVNRYPGGYTLDEMLSGLGNYRPTVTIDGLRADLLLLEKQGLVERLKPGGEYRLAGPSADLSARDLSNISQHAIEAVRLLTEAVLPVVELRAGKGYLRTLLATAPRGQGKALVRRLLDATMDICGEMYEDEETEEVTVVLGAAVTNNQTSG